MNRSTGFRKIFKRGFVFNFLSLSVKTKESTMFVMFTIDNFTVIYKNKNMLVQLLSVWQTSVTNLKV